MGEAKRRGNKDQRVTALLEAHCVKSISRERYNAFIAWTRSPVSDYFGRELEYFSNKSETIIGVLILDRTDRDFGYVLMGRDTKRRFRCIDVAVSMSKTNARHALFKSMKEYTESGQVVFPQHDEENDKAGLRLFDSVDDAERLHNSFKLLKDGKHWLPARSIIDEMMNHFVDVDGNFVQQFQTTGFDARIWELYLYAALLEMGLLVKKDHEAPDFEVSRGRMKVFIEAVTVGPSPNDAPLRADSSGMPPLRTPEEIKELLKTRAPIRFGSALYSKLSRKASKIPYWNLPHAKGYPLVFAVADFHEDQSMTWTSPALLEYLYGVTHDFKYDENGQLVITPLEVKTHEYNGKKIPSGFFLQADSENISAILFSSSGTISKFNRMGRLAGFGLEEQRIIRIGVKHRHDSNAALPEPFSLEIKQGSATETWAEGLSMFHNPNALHPVDRTIFPNIAHHYFVDGQIISYLPAFHPYSSFTWNIFPTEGETADRGTGHPRSAEQLAGDVHDEAEQLR